ncbi:MAG: PEGA domain-containing protein [Bacteroidetes bacterium]|nr:MAG: PEGA domain-containing protein [Bacteroidota bacterium]
MPRPSSYTFSDAPLLNRRRPPHAAAPSGSLLFTASMITPVSDLRIGTEFDGYRILGVLGQGGMGIVYKAEDVALSREVALKIIDPKLARSETFVRRFRAEARALARVHSPHIVVIHALRKSDPYLFIVMEYVDGGTLKDRIRSGPMPWEQAAPLIHQMLLAFDAAHSVGVIHRDIKPGNIMISRDGTVKVTDFGLAKLHDPNADATMTQGVAGTLFYMSPEQARGAADLDHRSDLYSLGMTIYEMLAGRLPFDRQSGEYAIMKTIVEGELPALHELNPRVPRALSDVVHRALEKDPADRYQTAREMMRAFEAYHGGGATATPEDATIVVPRFEPPPAYTERPPAASRLPKPLMLGGLALLAVLLAVAWFVWSGRSTTSSGATEAVTLRLASTPPGATVRLDGAPVGTTPLRIDTLSARPVRLELALDGYEPWEQRIVLQPGQQLDLTPSLQARSATLAITSTPSEAAVWINDEPRGTTPLTLTDIPPGEVRLRLTRPNHDPFEETLTLAPGEERPLAVALTRRPTASDPPDDTPPAPSPMTLTVRVLPTSMAQEVTVTVDGAAADGAVTLRPGTHQLACSHPRYGTARARLSGTAGATLARTCVFGAEVVVTGEWADGSDIAPLNVVITDDAGAVVARTTQVEYTFKHVLPPGTYRIRADRDDLPIVSVQDAERTLTIEPSVQESPDLPRHTITFRVQQN